MSGSGISWAVGKSLPNRCLHSTIQIFCRSDVLPAAQPFVCSLIRGDGWPLAVFRRAFSLPPALRPRHGPVHYSSLTLGLVLYIYRA